MTALFKKLNFKYHEHILVMDAPSSFAVELEEMAAFTKVEIDIRKLVRIEFALLFVTQQEQIIKGIEKVAPKLLGDAIVWFAYPKGSSKKYKCSFNRDTGWEVLGQFDFEPVRMVAIDEDWSALRFRKTAYIKTLKRREGTAISKEGKERTKKN